MTFPGSLQSLPELQELEKEDQKLAFRYAYGKRFRHWQTYTWYALAIITGATISHLIENSLLSSITLGLSIVIAMIFVDEVTKPTFKKYVLEYIQILNESKNFKPKIN